MMRFLRTTLVVLTMLLSIGIFGEWIRSYWKSDQLSLIHPDGRLDVLQVRQGMVIFHHHDPPPAGGWQKPLKPKLFESQDIALASPPLPFGQGKGWGPFQFNSIDGAGVMAAEQDFISIAHLGLTLSVFQDAGGNYRYDPETRRQVLMPGVPSKLSSPQQAEVARMEGAIALLMSRPGNHDMAYLGAPHWRVILPIWPLLAVLAAPSICAGVLAARKRRRCSRGLCGVCAYDLTGNQSGVCPECGTPVPTRPHLSK